MADNESKLSLENAKWAAEQLGIFTPAEQTALFNAVREQDLGTFEKILFNKKFGNSAGLYQGIIDINTLASQGINIPISQGQTENKNPNTPSASSAIGAMIGAGGLLLGREKSYENFRAYTIDYAEKSAKTWNKEELKLQKNPPKKPDPNRPLSRQESHDRAEAETYDHEVAYFHERTKKWAGKNPNDIALAQALDRREITREDLTYKEFLEIRQRYLDKALKHPNSLSKYAQTEIHDRLILYSPELAKQWARDYNDPELHVAIERKRQRDEAQALENQGRISRALGRNPAAKFASPASTQQSPTPQPNTISWATIPPNTLRGTIPQNTLSNQNSSSAPTPKQNPTIAPTNKGIGNKINYYRPGQIRSRTITRIVNSKFGQGIRKSHISRFGSELNKVGRKLKNLLNPMSLLLKFLKKTLIGSAITAIASAITTVISVAIGITAAIAAAAIGAFTAVAGFIIGAVVSIGIPGIIVAVIIAVMLLVFTINIPCVLFCNPETKTIAESPYPGISLSIIANDKDGRINNEEDLIYTITLIHDKNESSTPIEDITLYTLIPAGTIFVSATGNYDSSEPGEISWKLYPENRTTLTDEAITKVFVFTLTVDPDDDIVVTNSISIEGGITTGPGSGAEGPNDNLCQGNIYDYVLQNYLLSKNYGDPSCTLDTAAKRDQLYAMLQQKDPQWADFWFDIVIPGESGYRPNAWLRPVPDEEDPRDVLSDTGAWGLFQMGSSDPPGKLTNRNGTYRGDLTWPEQVDTALARNKYLENRGLLFKYWQVAIEYCRDGRLNEPQCRDM